MTLYEVGTNEMSGFRLYVLKEKLMPKEMFDHWRHLHCFLKPDSICQQAHRYHACKIL